MIWLLLIFCTFSMDMAVLTYLSHKQIEKKFLKKVKYILYFIFSLCFIWPIINFVFSFMIPNEKFMIGTWGTAPFFQMIFNFFAYISMNLLIIFFYCSHLEHHTWNRVMLGLKVFGLTVLLVISNGVCLLLDEGKNYSFTSPDNLHTIVVNEHNFLIAGWVTIYERKNPLIVSWHSQERTDDGYLPILSNDYTVTWYPDNVSFTFGDGAGKEKSVTISWNDIR